MTEGGRFSGQAEIRGAVFTYDDGTQQQFDAAGVRLKPVDRVALHDARRRQARNRRVEGAERFFNKLKHFRAIATRYDKLATNFLAGVQLACAMILLN